MSWHQKMGHLNEGDIKTALRQETIKRIDFSPQSKLDACDTCNKGKLISKPFPTRDPPKSTERPEITNSDVWGPFQVKSPGGASYFVTTNEHFFNMRDLGNLRLSRNRIFSVKRRHLRKSN
jgi:hypothetical protein